MPAELLVPDIGDFHDVPVIEVLVKPGDRIERESPLLTLESDKATMEIPASDAGVVEAVLVKIGDVVSRGTAIVRLAGTASVPVAPPAAAPAAPAAPAASVPAELAAPDPEPTVATPHAAPASPAPVVAATNSHAGPPVAGPVHASPSLRRFARELGVTLSAVRGTGPNGRITHADVQDFVKTALARPAPRRRRTEPRRVRACTWRPGRSSTSRSTARSNACRSRASRRSRVRTSPAIGFASRTSRSSTKPT